MDDFRTPGDGSFSLGSRTWPGLSKLVEECGEVLQIAGKIMGTGGDAMTPNASLSMADWVRGLIERARK